MSRLSYKTLFSTAVFLLIGIVVLIRISQKPYPAAAGWFNDGWQYRKSITVTNNTSAESSVYIQLTFNIGSTANAQSDDGDLRFTKTNGEVLPYYIVSGTGTTAVVVNVSLDSFPSGTQIIYGYYGNPSAPNGFSVSNFSTQASNYTIGSLGSQEVGGGPIAYWKFDEAGGSTAYDSTSNKYDASLGSGSVAPTWIAQEQCVSGSCLKFDGNSDELDVHDNTFSDTFSYSLWVKMVGTTGNTQMWSSGTTNQKFGMLGNKFFVRANATSDNTVTLPSYNTWHYLVLTRDSNNKVDLYVDGGNPTRLYGDAAQTGNASFYLIGHSNDGSGQYFNGFIDDVKIYPYARTANQIKQDYAIGLAHSSSSNSSSVNLGSSNKSSSALTDGLVGYWKMDENVGTTTLDASGNSNTGTLGTGSSAPGWVVGKYSVGLSFNGSTSYVTKTGSPTDGLALGNLITVSAWIKPTALHDTYNYLVDRGGTNSSGYMMYLKTSTSKFRAFIYNGSSCGDVDSNTTISTGVWTHVAFTLDGANLKYYINGVLDKTIGCTITPSYTSHNLYLGIFSDLSSVYAFNGSMDEVRIYNRPLSSSEVSTLYSYAPGPIAYYNFDEGVGSTVSDISGNNNNGTWQGTLGNQWINGKYGKAGNFNGSNNYISAPSISKLSLNRNFTLSAWIKKTKNSSGIVANGQSMWYFRVNSSGKLDLVKEQIADLVTGNTTLANNTWYHVAVTIDSGSTATATFYLNGIPDGSGTFSQTLSGSDTFNIGRETTGLDYFGGNIDELKVYNYSRTQKQITEDMGGGSSSTSSKSMLAYYKFDEGNGSTTSNSGNGGVGFSGVLGTGNSSPTWSTNGQFGKALSFDGNDSVSAGNSVSLDQSFTISTWLNVGSTVLYSGPWGKLWSYPRSTMSSSGALAVQMKDIGGTVYQTSYTPSLSINHWYQYTFSYDKDANKIYQYLDGVQKTGDTLPSGTYSAAGTFYIGYNQWYFNGLIDETKIYNYALTANEIMIDYNQGSTIQAGATSQTIGTTTTSLDYCVPGDTAICLPPVGEWNFNEGNGTTAYDTSGNNLNGSWSGTGSHWTNSLNGFGKAGNFNGTDDYVNVGDITTFDGLTQMTISTWIYPNSLPASTDINSIVAKADYQAASSNAYFIRLRGTEGVRAQFSDGTNVLNCDTTTMPATSSWTQITAVLDTSDKCYVYFNGRLQIGASNTSFTSINNDSLPLRFGSSNFASELYFDGKIDQTKIYNYARTPAQIAYDYNRGGPVGWWKFDECQGSIAYDSSGVGNTGAISIGATGSQVNLGTCAIGGTTAWGVGATGKYSGSLNFDGTDDYVLGVNSSSVSITGNQISLFAWVYPQANVANGTIITKTASYYLQRHSDGKLAAYQYGTSPPGYHYSTGTVPLNQWSFVGYTYDGSILIFYINGQPSGSVNKTGNITSSSQPIRIGWDTMVGGRYFNGQIDDARIYDYALTSTQVKTLYNNNSGLQFSQ